jgi:hypothetical protein
MEMIRYEYGSNYGHLDDIGSRTTDGHALLEECNKVFGALEGCYTGLAAQALQQKRIAIILKMEEILAGYTQTRKDGIQRQEDAAALDRHLAGGF